MTPAPLANGTVGTAYSASLAASSSDGGTYTYSWSAAGLPAGLNVDGGSGAVSGTPTAAGSATVTASTTVAGQTCSGNTSLTVASAATPQVDLEVTKVADKSNVKSGDTVRYTITVTNKGPGAATGVEVIDQLPAGVTYKPAYTASQGTYGPASGIWTVGSLVNGAVATLNIDVTVD